MPASSDASASVTRAGEAIRFAGALSRASVPGLWKQLPALDGVTTLDLTSVTSVDSAGLALLAEVSARAAAPLVLSPALVAGSQHAPPEGLAELSAAYRLDATLGFVSA